MKKLIKTKGTEFEQNGYDLAIIDTNFREGKPIMLNSKDLDMAILNGEQEALDKIESDFQLPDTGIIYTAWNADGFPTAVDIKGIENVPEYLFDMYNSSYSSGVGKYLTSINMDDGIKKIGRYAFAKLPALESLILSKNIEDIGFYAFYGCPNLKYLEFGDKPIYFGTSSSYAYTFQSCTNLKLNKIPEPSNGILPSNMFCSCTALDNDTLPESITQICGTCFYECTNAAFKELPKGLTYLGSSAFYKCNNVTFSEYPEALTEVPDSCFVNCYNVTFKTLPNVKVVQQRAFSNCRGLTQISAPLLEDVGGSAQGNPAFNGCTNLRAMWIGSAWKNSGALYSGSWDFYGSGLRYLFINKPRAEVEAIGGYSAKWSGSAGNAPNLKIICNDDANWMDQATFDSIDWTTHTL
jgi:hypothetical protein